MNTRLLTLALAATALTGFRPFSSEILETVEVVGEKGGKLRINKIDFNPDEHTLFADKGKAETETPAPVAPVAPTPAPAPTVTPAAPPTVTPAAPPAPAPTPVEAFVSKKGKKWVVVDKTGQSIAGTEEYDTEDAAKAAHAALSAPPAPAV